MRSHKWIQTNGWISALVALLFVLIPIFANARPWNEHTQHLAMLSRQIEMGENEIHALLDEKRASRDPKRVAEIIGQIAERYKALDKASNSYEEERRHVRFEHPDKNEHLDHTYIRHDVKTLEDMEDEIGIDARLDRVKLRVLAKYPIPEKKIEDVSRFRTRLPASKTEIPVEDAPEKIRLVK